MPKNVFELLLTAKLQRFEVGDIGKCKKVFYTFWIDIWEPGQTPTSPDRSKIQPDSKIIRKPKISWTNFKIWFLQGYWELEAENFTCFGSRAIFSFFDLFQFPLFEDVLLLFTLLDGHPARPGAPNHENRGFCSPTSLFDFAETIGSWLVCLRNV